MEINVDFLAAGCNTRCRHCYVDGGPGPLMGTDDAVARFLSQMGCRVQISLMINRFFAEDADQISRLIDDMRADDVYFAIPIFTPHANMTRFEPYRATLETFESIRRYLRGWRQDAEAILERARENSAGSAEEKLRYVDLHSLWQEKQDTLYLSLHQDCMLYVGNSGAETEALGDLRELEPERAAEAIRKLPGNSDYGAFYDIKDLPGTEDVREAMEALARDLVYGDFPSVLYRALVSLGVPTRLLSKA